MEPENIKGTSKCLFDLTFIKSEYLLGALWFDL